MKQILKEEPVYKIEKIQEGIKRTRVFVADDGKEFNTEKECISYEENRAYNKRVESLKVKHSDVYFSIFDFDFPARFYLLENVDDIEVFERLFSIRENDYTNKFLNGAHYHRSSFSIGEWYGAITIDGGDYRDRVSVYSLSFLKDDIANFNEYVQSL